MNKITKVVFLLFLANVLHADNGKSSRPYVTTSWSGTYYFEMIPPGFGGNASKSGKQLGWGIAYKLNRDGSREELWMVEGWYSSTVFLSEDTVHLVRLERENEITDSMGTDLAVAFYDKGKLLRQYSVAEMVKNQDKIEKSTSNYKWISSDIQHIERLLGSEMGQKTAISPTLRLDNTFVLETCDGVVFIFDTFSGEIIKKSGR